MSFVNALLRGLFDALLYPFRTLPAIVGLAVVSLVTAIAMLLVFKATSNQEAIEAVKRRIHAALFEIRLFNDDLGLILRAQRDILRHNLTYLRHSLVPMLFILPPLVLVIAQLQFHYAYAPLEAGDVTLLQARLAEGWEGAGTIPAGEASGKPQVALEVPAGIVVETPSVWVPSERTLTWRLRVEERLAGEAAIALVAGGHRYEKALRGGDLVVRRSPVRPGGSFVDQLVYPAEPPLPGDGPLETITIELPAASVPVAGGWTVDEMAGVPAWMVVFFVLSIVLAFALRKPFGVEI